MLTYGKVKQACARVLNLTVSDSRVAEYVNRAQEILLYEGKWVGTFGRFRICIKDSCITWSREIETIETYAINDFPGTVRGFWYEYLPGGYGIQDSGDCNGDQLIDRGNAVSYDDPDGGSTKILSLYAHGTESATTKATGVIIQFYDSNGQWVRSQNSSGQWIDGETLTIPAAGAYTDSVNTVSKASLIRIIKPKTNDFLRLYEKDSASGILKELGIYHPSEEIPVYRRSLVPGLSNSGNATCEYQSIEVGAKLRHIPVENDNDFLLIDSLQALILACKAVKKDEDNLPDESLIYQGKAIRLLDKQLSSWKGDGEQQPIAMVASDEYGPGVENLI